MNRLVLGFTALALSGLLSNLAQAWPAALAPPHTESRSMVLAQNLPGSSDNPYNSPIRRANPNSMQGTQPSVPTPRSPNTVPVPRPPTLDNGGIRNGYPRNVPAPGSVKPTLEPDRPVRDSDNSNR
ncbi:hypothetical protein [Pseudomonas fluorescens]|uniref:Lipoprotein n=1 Tax=Pseudomonas fluorescens TaxID=294 RepID=A0A5E7FIC5_PSEFL|nr:hypothetical protein [Pseudomonas fluorescens]VVO38522.1 hypothetical protein PS691_05519 [Pseudomonas fluorescens]